MTPRTTAALWLALGVLFLTSLWLVVESPCQH